MAVRPVTDVLIEFLNEINGLDPRWTAAAVLERRPCTPALRALAGARPHGPDMGLLGVLNAFCGSVEGGPRDGWGPISAVLGRDGNVLSFARTEGAARG